MEVLKYLDIQYIRDVIKETLEADALEHVRDELLEVLEMLEKYL